MPSTAVVPTLLDDPLAAGNHLGLFGYLHDELSTLVPSILALRFDFAFVFTESGVRPWAGREWAPRAAVRGVHFFAWIVMSV